MCVCESERFAIVLYTGTDIGELWLGEQRNTAADVAVVSFAIAASSCRSFSSCSYSYNFYPIFAHILWSFNLFGYFFVLDFVDRIHFHYAPLFFPQLQLCVCVFCILIHLGISYECTPIFFASMCVTISTFPFSFRYSFSLNLACNLHRNRDIGTNTEQKKGG